MCHNNNINDTDITNQEAKIMCKENFDYFKNNLSELLKLYKNKYIVLKNCEVIGSYNDFNTAINTTLKTEKLGNFLIQHCVSEDLNKNIFHSNNVSFSMV